MKLKLRKAASKVGLKMEFGRADRRNSKSSVNSIRARVIRVSLLLLVLILQLTFLTSCATIQQVISNLVDRGGTVSDRPGDSSQASDPDILANESTLSADEDSQLPSTKIIETRKPVSSTSKAPASATPAPLDDAFDERVTALIKGALDQYHEKAILDSAITQYQYLESQSDELIARIYDLYEDFYRKNPQYFWLDGSARITYSILETEQPTFSALTLEMGFSSGFSGASAGILKSRQEALLNESRKIADEARRFSEPWRQLLYVHDNLVQNLVYDTTLNQVHNNAASALLDHLTLCQGYAQSFQLITQALGFKVILITGTADNIDHAWNLVWLDGLPYHVDVTHDDPVPDGGSNDLVSHVHFLRSDAMMRQTHVWIAEDYPAVETDGAQFYRLQGLVAASRDELDSLIGTFADDADLSDSQPEKLELLYIGTDEPDKAAAEEILISHLRQKPGVRSIVYRVSVDKNVISLELLPS